MGNMYEEYRDQIVAVYEECDRNVAEAVRKMKEMTGIEIDKYYVRRFWKDVGLETSRRGERRSTRTDSDYKHIH